MSERTSDGGTDGGTEVGRDGGREGARIRRREKKGKIWWSVARRERDERESVIVETRRLPSGRHLPSPPSSLAHSLALFCRPPRLLVLPIARSFPSHTQAPKRPTFTDPIHHLAHSAYPVSVFVSACLQPLLSSSACRFLAPCPDPLALPIPPPPPPPPHHLQLPRPTIPPPSPSTCP